VIRAAVFGLPFSRIDSRDDGKPHSAVEKGVIFDFSFAHSSVKSKSYIPS
jgi:hypothetical protein